MVGAPTAATGINSGTESTIAAVPERVFLHIGPVKSGSTYLQSCLWANRTMLRANGIQLPGSGQIDHFRAGLDLRGLRGRGGIPPPVGSWDRLVAEIRESDARSVLVTDERLAGAASSHAARALRSLAPYDLYVIYAVREFSALLPSEWQERIKLAMDMPFEMWLESVATRGGPSFWRAHCLGNVFARWNVARDHVHLLIVPPDVGNPDELWRRFASIIDAPAELPNDAVSANQSLGAVESETVRRVYQHLDYPRPPARIEQVMKEIVSHQVLVRREPVRAIRLPESCRAWVNHQTDRRREFIDSAGCRIVGDPNELDVDPTRFVSDACRPGDIDILEAAVQVVGELTERIARRQRRRRRRAGIPRPTRTSDSRSALSEVGRRARVAVANRTGRAYFLHVGPPVAGSRTLQALLWANHAQLANAVHLAGGSPGVQDALSRPKQRATAWDRLVGDAEHSGHRRILITNETLATAGRKEIRRLLRRLDGADVHVIYVLRDLVTLLVAAWQRQTRTLPTPPWPEWVTELTDRERVGRGLAPAQDVGDDHTAEVVRRARERIGGDAPRPDLARVTTDVLLRDARPSPIEAAFTIPERARPWVEARSAARRSYVAFTRCHVVGDIAELDVGDSSYAPTVVPPGDTAALDAASEIAAALVTELAAVRWPDGATAAKSTPSARLAI